LQLKSRDGNMNGTRTMKNKGDRALDQQIIRAIENGINLSPKAAERAHAIMQIVLNSKNQIPLKVIEAFRTIFSGVNDANGHQISRKNAHINEIEEGKSRRTIKEGLRKKSDEKIISQVNEERVKTGLKQNGCPDLRTTKGQEKAKRAEFGLKNDGTPDLRTRKGKNLEETKGDIEKPKGHGEFPQTNFGFKSGDANCFSNTISSQSKSLRYSPSKTPSLEALKMNRMETGMKILKNFDGFVGSDHYEWNGNMNAGLPVMREKENRFGNSESNSPSNSPSNHSSIPERNNSPPNQSFSNEPSNNSFFNEGNENNSSKSVEDNLRYSSNSPCNYFDDNEVYFNRDDKSSDHNWNGNMNGGSSEDD